MHEAVKKSLEALLLEDTDLERLEAALNSFNIFEAVGAVRQELRHSDFLAYLLNPRQNHGLGDVVAKRLLQKALSSAPDTSFKITAIDVDTWDLSQLDVTREWQDLDILLADDRNKLAVGIENKIGTSEHSDQLQRYWGILVREFSGWNIIGLYLTPEGDPPSHPDYLPISYSSIASVLENLIQTRGASLNPDLGVLLRHYTQMLRRHIVSESEIAELCRRIYRKHKQALDLIFEHKPDQQATLREFLVRLIEKTEELVLDEGNKRFIRFAPKEWDIPELRAGQGWTLTGRIILFEFQNEPESLKLKCIIGPGPREIREKLFQTALRNQPFKPPSKSLNIRWNEIFSRLFLSARDYENSREEELWAEVEKHWQRFLNDDLPAITRVLNIGK